ncbi:4-alpha-glucanotransferase [Pseudoalteromonas luteoviolacea]|uniref:4-alpha-glucanotransferase n=1 Tax=Pseudoalteromonas luteoviolacea TaxID=43657 RepID=UPI001B37EC5F|nr:4-alpha-glucanotransferase [Pseudoalteromonas luteoviolacea]MBQ4835081.1 4-alpha-glucanotransferase [Pseudoalteromonas luteoviolacea]
MTGLQQLYYLHGVGFDFVKYDGSYVVFDEVTRQTAIECCGVDPQNLHEVEQINFELDIAPWTRVVEEVTLGNSEHGKFVIKVHESHKYTGMSIKIPEIGIDTTVRLNEYPEVGDYVHDNNRYIAIEIDLGAMPIGYFNFSLEGAFGQVSSELWSVPKRCFNPYDDNTDKKPLGISLQLYTLKSDRNYGVGDFTDLKHLIELFAQQGGDFVLLNPLHLLFAEHPEEASPYSPSHRCLINPLYIALDDIEQWVGSDCVQRFALIADVQSEISMSETFIDYTKTSHVKYKLFRHLYECWRQKPYQESLLQDFIDDKKAALGEIILSQFDWFLQWLAFEQIASCQALCIAKGMEIGLVNDLAVGCTESGLEYNSYQSSFSQNANIGAPPDPWAEQGQNWGMPALNPVKVKQDQFRYFRSLVKSNLSQVGALRIDHVMSLRRLWWCFTKDEQDLGCYVYYPFEYLLAVLKIESHLHSAIVIGEDLGVVPPEVTRALEDSAIFGNTLFYFEKTDNGDFKPSEQLRKNALIMVANHDVPPFHGWWNGKDLDIKLSYKLIDTPQYEQSKSARDTEKERLINWVSQHQVSNIDLNSPSQDVYQAVMFILAKSGSRLLAIQLDDLDLQEFPVNIPGTHKEYPNWRRKLNHELSELFTFNQNFIQQLNAIRKQS